MGKEIYPIIVNTVTQSFKNLSIASIYVKIRSEHYVRCFDCLLAPPLLLSDTEEAFSKIYITLILYFEETSRTFKRPLKIPSLLAKEFTFRNFLQNQHNSSAVQKAVLVTTAVKLL